jgi:hypothetical protein
MWLLQSMSPVALCLAMCVMPGCGPRLGDEPTAGESSTNGQTGHDATTYNGTTTGGGTTSTTSTASTGHGEASETHEPEPRCDHELERYFECDPWVQDCPAGEKCAPWTGGTPGLPNATHCVPALGEPKAVGETCTIGSSGADDCEVGVYCTNAVSGSDPVCTPLCRGCLDAPVCDDGSVCIRSTEAFRICFPECDPLGDVCPADSDCFHVSDLGCTFVCADLPVFESPHGAPCEYVQDCEQPATCIEAERFGPACEGEKCCTRFCDLDDPVSDTTCEDLTSGQGCVPLCAGRETHVGVCGVR